MDRIEEFATPIKGVLQAHPIYTFVALSLGFSLFRWNSNRVKVPTYGSEIPVLSFISAVRALKCMNDILAHGYKRYPIFKVPFINRWLVVVSGKYTDELHRAPPDVLSFRASLNQALQVEHTMGGSVAADPWHAKTVRGSLVRNLPNILGNVQEELGLALEDELALDGHEWKEIKCAPTVRRIISRVSNRVFVGPPLCRNPEWRDLNVNHTVTVWKSATFMNLFPKFIQPLIGKCLPYARNSQKKAEQFLFPIIEERYQLPPEERPNDMLTWLMEDAIGEEKEPSNLTRRILVVNFAAIHTTSMTFMFGLYKLLAHPQYIEPLREEVESLVKEQGWTKNSIAKMRKLDSFLRETQRLHNFASLSISRVAVKDFTFSDGTTIPKGTHLAAIARPVHLDEKNYEDPLTFKPFRFAEAPEGTDDAVKNQMVTTSLQNLHFGHGKNACPGRFFAVNELKCMMGHILMNYDIKWPNRKFLEAGYAPPDNVYGASSSPNQDATVMFRRRIRV